MRIRQGLLSATLFGLAVLTSAFGDDRGQPQPAWRIIGLSPHATELVFAAGAGDQLVAGVAHSDHPPAAQRLPRVGDAARLDRERILALRPDLVIAWTSGNRAQDLAWLERQGIPVYRSDPHRLDEIADQIEDIGRLAGTTEAANGTADRFRTRLSALRRRYGRGPEIPVFYQLWDRPLMTVDSSHLISEVLHLCGGRNIFPRLPASVAAVNPEAVIAANPEAIVAAREPGDSRDLLEPWRGWDHLEATQRGLLFTVPADLLHRPTPRILDAAEQICAQLASTREPGALP